MSIFNEVKEHLTARQVAEYYGLQVRRNGTACCPFHDDKHPSMKIDKNYHCFACGVGGDAVDYVSRTFGLSQYDAALQYLHDLLKDRIALLREILTVSDDEKLNMEILERIEYEEKAYVCFRENSDPGCIYSVQSDEEEYADEYFATLKSAVFYGVHHCKSGFTVEKRWLFDRNPKGLSEEAGDEEPEDVNEPASTYFYTAQGDICYGISNECRVPFDEESPERFESMFLYIKSPFGLEDIVMGPDFDAPRVVSTNHDCFIEHYGRLKDRDYIQFDATSNFIRTDMINIDGSLDYAHTIPFDLWKIDSWEDRKRRSKPNSEKLFGTPKAMRTRQET